MKILKSAQAIISKTRQGVYSQEERAKYCQTWKESSLNKTVFCKREQIGVSSLKRWLREEKTRPEVSLLPVKKLKGDVEKTESALEVGIVFPSRVIVTLPWQADTQLAHWLREFIR